MTERDPLLGVANASGFPLQIAIEHAVRITKDTHHWNVRYIEHSWFNHADERSGFIDLVLRNHYGTSTIVIECKRVRDVAWLFMRSDGTDKLRSHCKTWVSRYAGGAMRYFGWHDVVLDPPTVEALFCTVRGQSDSMPMLERIAADVVSSTEALAIEEKDYRPDRRDSVQFYFSVIVTTAELKVCKFVPDDISIKDGSISEASFLTVPFLRFRKQLSPRDERFTPEDYATGGNPSQRKEHTVFIVNSQALVNFLTTLEIDSNSANRFV